MLIQTIDATAIATALPDIARSFGIDPVTATLVITSYLIGMAVTVPAGGWLADRYGGANTFRFATLVVVLAAIGCVLASNLSLLMVARFIGGAASSLMLPIGRLMVVRSVPRERLSSAVTTFATIGLIGPIVGPLFGGVLVELFGWRSIFVAVLPLGVLIILAVSLIADDDKMQDAAKLDIKGLALCGTGLTCIVAAMEMLGHQAELPWVVGLLLAGFGLLASLGYHARTASNPLIRIGLLQRPALRASILSDFPMRMTISASPMLVSLLMQVGLHESAIVTGMMLLAPALGNLGVKPAIAYCLPRIGISGTMAIGAIVGSLAFVSLSLVCDAGWMVALLAALAVHGLGRAMVVNGGTILNFAQVSPAEMGAVTSLSALFQQMALVAGVGVATVSLRLFGDGPLDLSTVRMAILVMGMIGLLALIPLRAIPREASSMP
ncbi:Major Facilitator Superfamily protein [Sphingobium faniae]|nr:Major Facilitator Superfamily protein [Sphingobium faniae]